MSFYIKKSIRVGILRFNLSKSGVGVSAGIKGLRVGFGPRGNYVHAGANGVYYRSTLSPKEVKKSLNNIDPKMPQIDAEGMKEIDSDMPLLFSNSTSDQLVSEINEKFKMFSIWFIPLLASIGIAVYTHPAVCIAGLILTIPTYLWDISRRTVVLFYDFDEKITEEYKKLIAEWEAFTKVRAFWHIASEGKVSDWKKNAGADAIVKRNKTQTSQNPPSFIRANIPIPTVKVGSQTLCLLPEKILVFGNSKVASIQYSELDFDIGATKFIESGSVPSDSEVVDYTWQFVNKNGGPDKRFKNNRRFPVCLYETVNLTSATGLNERLMVSKRGAAEGLKKTLASIRIAS